MKKIFAYLLVAAFASCFTTSCSSDDDDKVPMLAMTTFNDQSGLKLTYNGEPMPGKTAIYKPNANDATKATIEINGNFTPDDLNRANASNVIAGPGVFPGSPSTTIDIDLVYSNGVSRFAGSGESEQCTFDYEGTVNEKECQLNFKNVMLKNQKLANTAWRPVQLNPATYEKDPIHIVWESKKGAAIMGSFEMPMQTIVSLMIRMDIIPTANGQKTSIDNMLCDVLHKIEFKPDGNIAATYVDAADGSTTPEISPANLAQYYVDDKIYLVLNPMAIDDDDDDDDDTDTETDADTLALDLSPIIAKVMPVIQPCLSKGFPLYYTTDGDDMTVYLGTDFCLPLFKAIAPMFADDKFVKYIIEMMKKDPDFGSMASMMGPVIKSIPEIVDQTTRLEIGLNLTKI